MREAVAKALCDAAGKSVNILQCGNCEDGKCVLWESFLKEADAAIATVRAHAMLTMRKKPRK